MREDKTVEVLATIRRCTFALDQLNMESSDTTWLSGIYKEIRGGKFDCLSGFNGDQVVESLRRAIECTKDGNYKMAITKLSNVIYILAASNSSNMQD